MKASILYLALIHVAASLLTYLISFILIITCNEFTASATTNSLILHMVAILDILLGSTAHKNRLLYPGVMYKWHLSICWNITLLVVIK